jgi:hypothetical protein
MIASTIDKARTIIWEIMVSELMEILIGEVCVPFLQGWSSYLCKQFFRATPPGEKSVI